MEGTPLLDPLCMDTDDDDPDYKPPMSHVSALPPPSAAERTIPTCSKLTEPYEPSDSLPVDMDTPDPTLPHYITRSHSQNEASSSALSISIALDPARAPVPCSVEEKDLEINRLWMTCSFLEQALSDARVTIAATNAHCTIMKRAESDAWAELQNKKNKSHCTVKTNACYVAHNTMREMHASQA